MARITVLTLTLLVAFLAISVCGIPEERVTRGFGNGGYGSGANGGYGRDSDERDASVSSTEGGGGSDGGCSSDGGRGYSGSRELAYNRDGRTGDGNRRGSRTGSFAKSSASASSSSISFGQNQRSNVIQ